MFTIYTRNNVSRVYSYAALRYAKFMLDVMLFPMLNVLYWYISTPRSMCAVPSVAVFWSPVNLCFPGMFLRYFRNDF